ncbi:MAG: KAP family NTPase [Muribaculum sp.]|nr:KAP family NTPase [Muribaculum sp.]
MFEIPLDKEINRFSTHLKSNPRIIFSAKFGDGKTYFLKRFKQSETNRFRVLTLYPLNYSVAQNEDIFEYIKRDILLQLKDDGIYESFDIEAFEKSLFSTENILEVISFLTAALPGGELLNKLIKKGVDIKAKYDEQRRDTANEFLDKFTHKTGCIYERDAFTILIENVVKRIKATGKKVVLLIEDLDRIDPKHVFRILNILGAHIDEEDETNKFGFDNIVVVLDYEITEHIFHHFYGPEANYSGYMSKFVSHYPYIYSITKLAHDYLYEVIEEKCGLTRVMISEFEIKGIPYHEVLSNLIATKSVRDIVKILDNLDSQYETCVYQIRGNYLIKTDAPIVIFLSIIKRLQYDISDHILLRSIRLIIQVSQVR